MKAFASYAMALALLTITGYACADARSDYYQRAAADDQAAFHALDVNHDGVVERDEIVGDNDFGKSIGLSKDWAYNVIKAVGNYGEIYDRNIGPNTPLGLQRGVNAQWNKGGIQYGMPIL